MAEDSTTPLFALVWEDGRVLGSDVISNSGDVGYFSGSRT
jgi:hypothetical protein